MEELTWGRGARSDPWLVLFSSIDFGASLIGFDIESVSQSVGRYAKRERRSIDRVSLSDSARWLLQVKAAIHSFILGCERRFFYPVADLPGSTSAKCFPSSLPP